MNDITLNVVAKFFPGTEKKTNRILSRKDFERYVSDAMAHAASSCSVRGIHGAAKRAVMIRAVKDALASAREIMPPGMMADEEDLFTDIGWEKSYEAATIHIRRRTALDAMAEAVCGK